ncbi:MAG: putative manganese-dependent inorganic diphosphatase [Spirochaetaceae bacterium JB067]
MRTIYVCGHRNPDLDSVCAAWCYARLKNIIDDENTYVPIRLGHMNATTKNQFEAINVVPPAFVKDIRARVHQVMNRDYWALHPQEPVYSLVRYLRKNHASVVPLLEDQKYRGLLSLDEITMYFLKENSRKRPKYRFYPKNFTKVIEGELLQGDVEGSFDAYIMTGAMEYDVYQNRLQKLLPDLPLLVVGNRKRHLQYAIDSQFPAIVLTGVADDEQLSVDLSNYRGIVYRSFLDTAETIRLLRMSLPVSQIVSENPPSVDVDDLFDDAKRVLVDSDFRGLPVFDEDEFVGFVTRRCFLERPRSGVIMVDHNELKQSVEGIEESDVLEIIDHHRLDAERTRKPIFIASEPVGSTCTIIYHQYKRWNVEIDRETAFLLLSGIVSDTVMLKSPTTTDVDRSTAEELVRIGKVEDFSRFCEDLFAVASVLKNEDERSVIESDFKTYREKTIMVGIGQVEVNNLAQVDEVRDRYIKGLEAVKREQKLDWTMLLVTDVRKENSILLCSSFLKDEKVLAYPLLDTQTYHLEGVLSRKKQLLPEILRVIEEYY